jgi:hypothetical protein
MRLLPGCSVKETACLLCADATCVALLVICMAWGGNPARFKRPRLPCPSTRTSSPDSLTNRAVASVKLTQPGASSNGNGASWPAAEFQGFVDGIPHRTIIGKEWCPGVIESGGKVDSIVAGYLIARRPRQSAVGDTTSTVVGCRLVYQGPL